jgi:hypothetical protein
LDKSEVEAIARRELPRLADLLHVSHWTIDLSFDTSRLHPTSMAECERRLNYDQATITLHPEKHIDEADVIDSIEHELLHIVMAPFDLSWNVVSESFRGIPLEHVKTVWQYSLEQTIVTLQRILRDLSARAAKPDPKPEEERPRPPRPPAGRPRRARSRVAPAGRAGPPAA